jgi:hypothetical protein
MLELALKKKDSYFKVINIELSFVNNVEENNQYKFEKLLDKRITSRDSKDRRKKIV